MNKTYLLVLSFIIIQSSLFAQNAESLYNEGLKKVDSALYQEAIDLFDQSITIKKKKHLVWYNRGVAKMGLKLYESALADYNQTIKLDKKYKEGYFSRGLVKQKLIDYDGALMDLSKAIELDTNYAEAYFKRAHIYSVLSQKDNACNDFTIAYQKGIASAKDIVRRCNSGRYARIPKYAIRQLSQVSEDPKYGFVVEKPVKVGKNIEGGRTNQIAYLDLLRSPQGNPVDYEFAGNCCPYPSAYGSFGMGSLDKYEIKYVNEKGEEETIYIFLTFYDYEDPKIINGLKTIGMK